ncbi:MAG: hypothetical protein D6737_19370 [Chloroflexi bacterium]|nr:MAG: hypothetical protein D6737_19370 [Chloroflexota bacterium]
MQGEIVVAVFPSRKILIKALDRMTELDYIQIKRSAIIAKAHDGAVVILDDDISADEGGVAGGLLGAALTALGLVQLGVLSLPVPQLLIALVVGIGIGGLIGRAVGRVSAHLLDFGFKNEQVEALAHKLQVGRPALVLELQNDRSVIERLQTDMKPFQALLVDRLREVQMTIADKLPSGDSDKK